MSSIKQSCVVSIRVHSKMLLSLPVQLNEVSSRGLFFLPNDEPSVSTGLALSGKGEIKQKLNRKRLRYFSASNKSFRIIKNKQFFRVSNRWLQNNFIVNVLLCVGVCLSVCTCIRLFRKRKHVHENTNSAFLFFKDYSDQGFFIKIFYLNLYENF